MRPTRTDIAVVNPAAGDEISRVPDAGAPGRFAAGEWRGRDESDKERSVLAVADVIDRERRPIGELVSHETGKTRAEAPGVDANGAAVCAGEPSRSMASI